ncbi:transcriptional regulator TenI [Fictibacillus macauensis ZFHKF-1]|uniref:Transcriptional regulator TenI n=1 Tax=Fictibacillus macauensis ZFHKF-1 TaxID=1196324 RepID=I8AIZ3_9BACL|nr:thiamine phosphate synthase [Fictibacillus macauensis]EIT85747.1 transcriptional regulator TenI [Fictibacillus macauensis ZFHKF-1]
MEYEFHVITNGIQNVDTLTEKAMKIAPYVSYVHLRENGCSGSEIYHYAQALLRAGFHSSSLVINHCAEAASAVDAGGLHLKGTSLPVALAKDHYGTMRIGRSVHSLSEGKEAEFQGADYVLFGHVFQTNSKQNLPARGLLQLQEIASKLSIPVIAIGGIAPENVSEVIAAGASGIAVMSGVWNAPNALQAVKRYYEALNGRVKQIEQTI